MHHQPPPVCNPDGIAWFVRHRDGVVRGPFPFESLLQAAQAGRLASDTLVSHPDFTQSRWVLANALPELAMLRPAVPTAAAPTAAGGRTAAPPRPPSAIGRRRHPGKRMLLAAILIWLGGLPLVYAGSLVQAHHGGEYRSDTKAYVFDTFVLSHDEMTAREQEFSGRNVALWSSLWGAVALIALVVMFTVPERPWRPDLTLS